MKKKHYKKNYKRTKVQRYSKETKPEFLIEVKMLTLKDLHKMNLIDSRAYRESVKKQINSDYQGGNANE